MKAICPGSFDPVTHGHLDIIQRTADLFAEVVVAVGRNSAKNYLFSPDERVDMVRETCEGIDGVEVKLLDGLLVDFCATEGAGTIVKGLRFGGDFEFELQMAHMNHALSGVETVMLPTAARWAHLSSTMIREIASLGGDIAQFVPESVSRRVAAKVAERRASDR